jgi:hypothetical protein
MATAFVDAGGVVCPAAISSWGGIMLPMGKGNRRRNFYLLQKPAGHSPKRPISPENVHHCAIPSTQESDIVLPVVADVRSVAVSFLDVRCNVILPPISRETDSGQSRLKLVLCSVSISLGLILALCGDSYGGDAVSYLDMGDSFFSGDWRAIVNALWSPLFPFLHGLTRWVFKPSMRWEPMVVYLTNFLIYLTTVVSFHFFWGEVLRLYKRMSGREGQNGFAILSDSEFWVFGYAIFLYMHLQLVTSMHPDMLLSAFVYLSAGLILRIQLDDPTLGRFCLLGLLLGLGFLTKAVMLPLAGVFLAAAVLPNLRRNFVFPCALASALVFSAVVGPYVFELSKKKGHFTTGQAGSLNYAWHVNGVPGNWQGGPPELGRPKHPLREVFSSPRIFEFGTPVLATYPPWYDPSYWYEGLHFRFDLADQLTAFKRNLRQYLEAFRSQQVLIAGVLVLLAMRQMGRTLLQEFAAVWYLWAPTLAAFTIYGILWVEWRYLAQFLVLFWGAALTLVRLPEGRDGHRFIRAVITVVVTLMSVRVAVNFAGDTIRGRQAAELQMKIAEGLAAKGMLPGEKVAVIEGAWADGCEKLARISVVAVIPDGEDHKFWSADPAKRTQIYQVLAKTGANVLIAPEIPDWASTMGWERIASTPVYVFYLN